uniref:Uncharacterized protein n=1 Tax=Riboviria sp. TaxID=2585031 RepID=A0A8K1U2J7_9VIRU|nr:MAG: hypothetical protein 3 [Riboviria sp.]
MTIIAIFWTISVVMSVGGEMLDPPIVSPEVASVAFPLDPIYVARASWSHSFRVPLPCLSRLVTPDVMDKIVTMVKNTKSVYTKYTSMCGTERDLTEQGAQYICTLLNNELTLMNSTLNKLKRTVSKSNNQLVDYKNLILDPNCHSVSYPPDLHVTSINQITASPVGEMNRYSQSGIRRKRHTKSMALINDIERRPQDDVIVDKPRTHSVVVQLNNTIDHSSPLAGTGGQQHTNEPAPHIVNNYIFNGTTHFYTSPLHGQEASPKSNQYNQGIVDQPSSVRTNTNGALSQRYSAIQEDPKWSLRGARDMLAAARSACYRDPLSPVTRQSVDSYRAAIQTFLDGSKLTFCDIDSESAMCDQANAPAQLQHKINRRKRAVDTTPGWLPWSFSVSKWMWGGLNSRDGEEINDMFKTIQNEVKDTTKTFIHINNQTVSALSTMRSELLDYNYLLVNRLDQVTNTSEEWRASISPALDSLSHNVSVTSMLALGSLLLSQSGQVRDYIDQISESLMTNVEDNHHIFESIMQRSVPDKGLSISDMDTALTYIAQQIPENLQIVPVDHLSNVFEYLLPVCTLVPNGVMFRYTIPLVSKPYTYQAWQVSSLPMDTGLIHMQVALDSNVVLYSKVVDHWFLLNDASFTACSNNKVRVCPFSPPSYSIEDPNCAMAIVKGRGDSGSVCNLVASPFTRLADLAILPIDGRRWLVSAPLDGISSTLRCMNNVTGVQEDVRHKMSGIELVSLPRHCALSASETVLVSFDNEMYQSISTSSHIRAGLPNDISFPSLSAYDTIWNQKRNSSGLLKLTKLKNFTLPHLELRMSGMSINNLTELIKGSDKMFNETFEQTDKRLADDNYDSLHVRIPGTSGSLSIPFSYTLFVTLQIIIDVALVGYVVLKVLPRLMMPVAPLALGARKPFLMDTFAQALTNADFGYHDGPYDPFHNQDPTSTSTVPTTTTTVLPTTLASIGSEKTTKVIDLELIDRKLNHIYKVMLDQQHKQTNMSKDVNSTILDMLKLPTERENLKHFIWMFVIMIVVGIFCHKLMMSGLRSSIAHYSNRVDGVIKNNAVLHHGPEAKLIASFVIRLFRNITCSSDTAGCVSSMQLVMIQLCTLPHNRMDYVLDQRATSEPFLQAGPISRFQNALIFDLKWGMFCLRLKNNLDLEICESLPKRVCVSQSDVVAGFGDHVPKFWTHIEVEGLTHMYLHDVTGSSILYQAGEPGKYLSNQPVSTRPLLSERQWNNV